MGKAAWGLAPAFMFVMTCWSQQPSATSATPKFEKLETTAARPLTNNPVTEPPPCPAQFDDSLAKSGIAGKEDAHDVIPPKPKVTPAAEFSQEARRRIKKEHIKNFEAISIVSFVVDVNGDPQDLCLVKPAGYGLDVQAAKAAWRYKFDPGTKNGNPVPVRLHVEVNFRLY